MQDAGAGASAYRRGAAASRSDDGSPGKGEAQALKPQQLALGDDDSLAELEDEATTPARFGQLALYATACLMCSFDWNIMVRARAPWRQRNRCARGLNRPRARRATARAAGAHLLHRRAALQRGLATHQRAVKCAPPRRLAATRRAPVAARCASNAAAADACLPPAARRLGTYTARRARCLRCG